MISSCLLFVKMDYPDINRDGKGMREKMTFRLRIMLSIIIVTISGLSAFFFFTYYVATDLVENNYAKSLTNSMKLRMEQIDEDMRDAYQKTIAISVQDELNSVIL